MVYVFYCQKVVGGFGLIKFFFGYQCSGQQCVFGLLVQCFDDVFVEVFDGEYFFGGYIGYFFEGGEVFIYQYVGYVFIYVEECYKGFQCFFCFFLLFVFGVIGGYYVQFLVGQFGGEMDVLIIVVDCLG